MKFFLDENFSKLVIEYLTELGHEVIDSRDVGLISAEDWQIFEFAQEQEAVLLTTDRDFYHRVAFGYSEHCGVIVVNLRQPNKKAIFERFKWAVEHNFLDSIENTVVLLRDKTYRTISTKEEN